jgi:hypothetical protein
MSTYGTSTNTFSGADATPQPSGTASSSAAIQVTSGTQPVPPDNADELETPGAEPGKKGKNKTWKVGRDWLKSIAVAMLKVMSAEPKSTKTGALKSYNDFIPEVVEEYKKQSGLDIEIKPGDANYEYFCKKIIGSAVELKAFDVTSKTGKTSTSDAKPKTKLQIDQENSVIGRMKLWFGDVPSDRQASVIDQLRVLGLVVGKITTAEKDADKARKLSVLQRNRDGDAMIMAAAQAGTKIPVGQRKKRRVQERDSEDEATEATAQKTTSVRAVKNVHAILTPGPPTPEERAAAAQFGLSLTSSSIAADDASAFADELAECRAQHEKFAEEVRTQHKKFEEKVDGLKDTVLKLSTSLSDLSKTLTDFIIQQLSKR